MNDLESAIAAYLQHLPKRVVKAIAEASAAACHERGIKLKGGETSDEKSGDETSDEENAESGGETSAELFPELSRAHAIEVNNKNISNLIKDIKNKKKENAKKKEKESETAVDVKRFFEFFNKTVKEAGSVMPTVTKSSKARSRAIGARAREFGKEALKTMVEKAAGSDFLNGKNDRSWVATIDWLLRPNNFAKVLDGNYDNRKINNCHANDYRQQVYDRRRGWDAVDIDPEDFAKGYRHKV